MDINWILLLLESFLPLRDDFHPRRNQARQKLATLPSTRFKDLASDVYHELKRRYPQVVVVEEQVFKDIYKDYIELTPS